MKYNQTILDRVRILEEKRGIHYAKPDGVLFRRLRVLYIIAFAYTMGINLIFLAGQLLMLSTNPSYAANHVSIVTITVCTLALIAGLVMLCLRLRFTGAVCSAVALIFMTLTYSTILRDSFGYFGHKPPFYWRHFIPAAVMLVLLIGMTVIAVRARLKTDALYKTVLENVYRQYHIAVGKDAPPLTDDQWEELLDNYDPRGFRKKAVREEPETDDNADL